MGSAQPPPPIRAFGTQEYDVAIIGAGPVGLALAIETARSGLTTLVVDGQGFYPMHQGDEVKLARHPVPYPLLSRPGHDPFMRLRDRLGWRGSFEPDVFPARAPEREHETDTGQGGVL